MNDQTMAHLNAANWLHFHTHGHVVWSKQQWRARCGGTGVCATCKVEQQLKNLIESCEMEAFGTLQDLPWNREPRLPIIRHGNRRIAKRREINNVIEAEDRNGDDE